MSSKKNRKQDLENALKSLREREKERICLYNISNLDQLDLTVEELIEQTAEIIKTGLQFPEHTEVEICFEGKNYQSENYSNCESEIFTITKENQKEKLSISVCYSGGRTGSEEFVLCKEEQELIDTVADLISLKIVQKKTWLELKESNERFKYINKVTDEVIYDHDFEKDEITISENFEKIFGHKFSDEEFTLDIWEKFLHPDDRDEINRRLEKTLEDKNENKWIAEFRYAKKDGSYVYVLENSYIIRDNSGNVVRMIGSVKDISDQKIRELQKTLSADISLSFNQSESLKEAVDKTLGHIYSINSFDLAEFWLVDKERTSINLISYYSDSLNLEKFYKHVGSINSFKQGVGLPGQTWKKKKTLFWRNLGERKSFIRSNAAKKAGLKTAISFPITDHNEVIGVLVLGLAEDLKKEHYTTSLFHELTAQLTSEIRRKELEEELSRIFMSAPDIICIAGLDGYYKKINPAMSKLFGYSEEELLNTPIIDFVHPSDKQKTKEEFEALNRGEGNHYFKNRHITRSGKVIWISWTTKPIYNEGIVYSVGKDVTEQKELEDLLNQANRLARIGSWEVDLVENTNYWSDITKEIHEVPADYTPRVEKSINFYKEGEHRKKIQDAVNTAIEIGEGWDLELIIITAKGNEHWVRTIGDADLVDGKCVRMYGSFQDIHDLKMAQEKILQKTRQLDVIANFNGRVIKHDDWAQALDESLAEFAEVVDADRAYYFENSTDSETGEQFSSMLLEWSTEDVTAQIHLPEHQNVPFELMGGFVESLSKNQLFSAIVSNISNHEFKKLLEGQDIKSVLAVPVFTGNLFRGFIGFDDCRNERKWRDDEISFFQTIAINLGSAIENEDAKESMKELNRSLEQQTKELAISNAELEQFAFVASHDLQEPLRMITSFLAQLERKYGDVLDEKARQYIHFATDGAKRMRQIILDLLDFSRVGRVDTEREEVDLNELLQNEIRYFNRQIKEINAEIKWDKMPVIIASKGPLKQVFHNLIGNGLKYQREGNRPEVVISAEETETYWKFSVQDNGIGINPEYSEKIFNIFQRLHNRDEYEGTGVGLAICKKVVEDHGGEIWVESEEGIGSTFHFTIKKSGDN